MRTWNPSGQTCNSLELDDLMVIVICLRSMLVRTTIPFQGLASDGAFFKGHHQEFGDGNVLVRLEVGSPV